MRASSLSRLTAFALPLAVLLLARGAGGVAPVGQYVLGAQTALDTKTGLRWQRVSSGGVTWASALQACSTITLDGETGYRLPTVRELESMYEVRATTGPLWDKTVFSSAVQTISASDHWASEQSGTVAYLVSFTPPGLSPYMGTLSKTNFAGARCVKGP